MARGECSICSTPGLAAEVDALLDQQVFLSDIATRLNLKLAHTGISLHRSSIHRHAKAHYNPRQRAAALKRGDLRYQRGAVLWPGQPPPVPGTFDYLIRVTYEKFDLADKDKNLRAISPTPENLEKLFALALAEDAQRMKAKAQADAAGPSATRPPNEEQPEETMEPEPESPREEQPSRVRAFVRKLLGRKTDSSEEQPAVVVQPPAPSLQEIQAHCNHDMKAVSAGVERCNACGLQKTEFSPIGVSRDYHTQRPKYGRFG